MTTGSEPERVSPSGGPRLSVLRMIGGLVAGVVIGAVSVLAIQDAVTSPTAPGSSSSSTPAASGSSSPVGPTADVALPSKTAPAEPDALLLAWTSEPVPETAAAQARQSPSIGHATAVRRNELDLTAVRDAAGSHLDLHDGYVVPLDTMAFDPGSYLDFVPASSASLLGSLRDDQVVLSRAGADLRGVGVGASLTLSGRTFTVAGVVDDDVLGGAEAGLNRSAGAGVGLQFDRYLLATYRTDRPAAEAVLTAAIGAAPIRFRGPGETPFLRNADAVLPLAVILSLIHI